jgi:hypothetical protein
MLSGRWARAQSGEADTPCGGRSGLLGTWFPRGEWWGAAAGCCSGAQASGLVPRSMLLDLLVIEVAFCSTAWRSRESISMVRGASRTSPRIEAAKVRSLSGVIAFISDHVFAHAHPIETAEEFLMWHPNSLAEFRAQDHSCRCSARRSYPRNSRSSYGVVSGVHSTKRTEAQRSLRRRSNYCIDVSRESNREIASSPIMGSERGTSPLPEAAQRAYMVTVVDGHRMGRREPWKQAF